MNTTSTTIDCANGSCLVCLENDKEFIEVFSRNALILNIEKVISKHFWFRCSEGSMDRICFDCWRIISEFDSFYDKISDAHSNFKKIAAEIKIETDDSNEYPKIRVNNESEEISNVSVKDETIMDITDNLRVFIEETPCEYEPPTPGKIDVLKNDNDEIPMPPLMYEDDSGDENVSSESEYEYNENDQESDDSIEDSNSKYDTKDGNDRDDNIEKDNELRKTPKKRGPKPKVKKEESKTTKKYAINSDERKEEEDEIRSVVSMKCDLCDANFNAFRGCKNHYYRFHNTEGYLKCCDIVFYKRNKLIQHIQLHLNPNGLECSICKRNFSNKRRLKAHMDNHINDSEKKFKCDKCAKIFFRMDQLRSHLLRHAEKNHQCETCTKSYATKSQLNNHIKAVHEKAFVHICDICARVFRNKAIYEKHKLVVHSEVKLPPAQCQYCGSWLKHEVSLKAHIKRHHSSDGTKHICDICGRESPNSTALYMHKKKVHIMQRIHKCNICEKAFKEEKALKEHMAALHTGDLLYSCEFCTKKCNSSATMHAHRKKMHPMEWQEEQMRKYSLC